MDNILMNGSKKFGSFIIGPHIFPQRTKFPVHWHDYFEFEFVVEGTGENCHNNIKQIVEAGSAYLMSYYDFHSFETITEMKIINVRFNENMLPAELVNFLLLGTCNIACRFDPDESRYILNLLHMLEDEKKQGKQFSSLASTNILSLILINTIRKSNPSKLTGLPTLVQQTIAYIYDNFKNKVTLDEISRQLSVSPTYLSHVFNKSTETTLNNYLNLVRLKYACKLLVSTDRSVKEIAFESGYNSLEYFLYVFKDKLKTTPGKYRKNNS